MDRDIFTRPDELWIVVARGQYPEPFDDMVTVAEAEEKISDRKQRFRGTPSSSTAPGSSTWLVISRTEEFDKIMNELAKVQPKSPSDSDTFGANIERMIHLQMRHIGYALRYHNQPFSQEMVKGMETGQGLQHGLHCRKSYSKSSISRKASC